MNIEERRKQSILFTLGILSICSTEQIARLFPILKYPKKEASKLLKELERKKLVEGFDRRLGESKLWRLTRRGKNSLEIDKRSTPFTSRNMAHLLKIADCYFDLMESGNLSYFELELREEFEGLDGERYKYCPDAFFIYENEPYFLEVQRSALSRKKWAEKWKIANEFFSQGHLLYCSVKEFLKENHWPKILGITEQKDEIVQTGAKVNLLTFFSLRYFCKK